MLIIVTILAILVLGLTIWAQLTYSDLPMIERLGLGTIDAGIVWGGHDRLYNAPIGGGDILLLLGVAVTLWRFFVLHPIVKRIYK